MPQAKLAWFYVTTKEAKVVLEKIFATPGIQPGSFFVIPDEDFKLLRESTLQFPVYIVDNPSQIDVPRIVLPQAS